MHVRIRVFGKPDTIVVVDSKLTKIEQFRRIIKNKFDVDPKLQRLFYGGKLLEDGYSFHDYNIKLNDVIQLMVKIQDVGNTHKSEDSPKTVDKEKKGADETKHYKDAESNLYAVGDLIDIRDQDHGSWYEGKITRIVYNPDISCISDETCNSDDCNDNESIGKENDAGNKLPSNNGSPKGKGIERYFITSPKVVQKKQNKKTEEKKQIVDANLLFKVEFDDGEDDSAVFCKLHEIRPRARKVIDPSNVQIDQTVMLNYNTDDPRELGLWYDFKVADIKKIRSAYDFIGTLYLGSEAVPQNDTKVRVKDKIYAIEEVVPLAERSDEYKKLIATAPDKRTTPLNCLTCRDDEDSPCKDCGCYLCSGKEFPEKIVLCDECNKGYHMICLDPPLTELPEEDWYCPSCKRDTNDVIAPGAAKQTKKTLTSKRDWGRGMACVGKTKTCAMPPNHFGPIPGIEVGMCWRFRIQLSETGVHRPPVSGIHGRDVEGAYSIVLSGGYEDDVDFGNEFTYTGSGGRDLSGNKRTAEQSCDQTLTRENKALARNCAVKQITEEGGDAGENWRHGRPVRVVRSYKMLKHFPKYAPKEGIRYDGIYKVVKYYPEKGLSGFRVWKYLLRRDDPTPAPWEPGAKQYPIVYPDGYLEAEAEKKAIQEKNKGKAFTKGKKKRALKEINQSTDTESEASPPIKKKKKNLIEEGAKKYSKVKKNFTLKELNHSSDSENDTLPLVTKKKKKLIGASKTKTSTERKQNGNIPDIFKKSPNGSMMKLNGAEVKSNENPLTAAERETIEKDTLNSKLWSECLIVCDTRGKKEFVEYVTEMFMCIICQEVAVCPITTTCLHNFCMACIKMAFKSTGVQCPCCRKSLVGFNLETNENLKAALRCVLTGYDAGKK